MIINIHLQITGEKKEVVINWGTSYKENKLTEVNPKVLSEISKIVEKTKLEIQKELQKEDYQVTLRKAQLIL